MSSRKLNITGDNMLLLKDLNEYLTELLGAPPPGRDARANGMQVPGREQIRRIGFGVSASHELFKLAHNAGCDCVIVHHGIDAPPDPHFNDVFLNRIKFLLERDMSLFGFHYTLDAHPEIGHAALIIKGLGGKPTKPFFDGWGWYGELESAMHMDDAVKLTTSMFEREGYVYRMGPSPFTKVAAVSGGGAPKDRMIKELQEEGVGLYITGSPGEDTRELMRDAGINLIASGHYATERLGVKALMDAVNCQFDVPCEWIELYNEV
jgi:dinuclear metal center YbgI/SA1388 family protein